MSNDFPAMTQKHLYPVEAPNGVMTLPEHLIGIEESALQMLALLLKVHPGTTIKQTSKNWDEWTAYLPDGRKVWVGERRDFWDECEKCGGKRNRIRTRGGKQKIYVQHPSGRLLPEPPGLRLRTVL